MHLQGDLCNYMYVGFFQGELGEPGSDGKDGDRGSLVSYHYSTFVVRTNSHQEMKSLLVEQEAIKMTKMLCMMTLPQKRSEKQEPSNKTIFDWESKRISLVLLYFVLWLVQKTRATFLTDQMQNYNQSLLGRPRFPAL